jgi:hypothetical protein
MSQNDFTIANQGFPAFRSDLNSALQALGSSNSGTSEPSTMFANQIWYDTSNNILKIRNEDNDAWISLLTLDQVNDNIEAIQATLVTTNTISEETSGNGVIVDGVTLKDSGVGTTSSPVALYSHSLNGGQFGGKRNLIINGAMQINQRGASSVTSGYFVDRFTLSACSASAVLTSSTPTEFPKAISVSATSGNPIILQKIESKSCQGLSGKTVTASFYAKNISNATTLYASLQYAGSADNFGSTTTISEQNLGSLSGSWVRYTASWTVPSGGLNGLSLNILCAGSSTFTMGVTGVQLEVGSVATPFEHRLYGEELALCQRYYYDPKLSGGNYWWIHPILTNSVGHYRRASFPLPTEMRTDATATFTAVSNGSFAVGFPAVEGNDHTNYIGFSGDVIDEAAYVSINALTLDAEL